MTESGLSKPKSVRSGRKATVGRLFVLDLSSGRIFSLNADGSVLESQNYVFLTFTSIFMLSLILIPNSLFQKAFAASPAFDQVLIPDKEICNQKNDWIQAYGNDSTHLRSDYANILAVDYVSDGKTLDATFWLASNSENASIYNQPLKHIRYGMLIAVVSLPENSGYNGANYNYSLEMGCLVCNILTFPITL
jgi:hypothetical protein